LRACVATSFGPHTSRGLNSRSLIRSSPPPTHTHLHPFPLPTAAGSGLVQIPALASDAGLQKALIEAATAQVRPAPYTQGRIYTPYIQGRIYTPYIQASYIASGTLYRRCTGCVYRHCRQRGWTLFTGAVGGVYRRCRRRVQALQAACTGAVGGVYRRCRRRVQAL
jgi:hypothetical protein